MGRGARHRLGAAHRPREVRRPHRVGGGAVPIERNSYWQSLPEETRLELTRRTAAFRLSNFLHGEQGALMVAAQLVNAVPHTDAKFYAATQTMDEARHVEVFARYSRSSTACGRSPRR